MELSEAESIQKYAKQSKLYLPITLLPYKHEFIFVSCTYFLIKRKKTNSVKIQGKN